MRKRIQIISTEEKESSLFNSFEEYCTYIDIDSKAIGKMKVKSGQQFGALIFTEEYLNAEKVAILSDKEVREIVSVNENRGKLELYYKEIKRAIRQNQTIKNFPKVGDSVKVVSGRKIKKGSVLTVVRYVNDRFPTKTGSYLNSKSNLPNQRANAISDYVSRWNREFISDVISPIIGKALMCKDFEGKTVFIKPKYVKSLSDNRKPKRSVIEFAAKKAFGSSERFDISSLWSTSGTCNYY